MNINIKEFRIGNLVIDTFDKQNIHATEIDIDDLVCMSNWIGAPTPLPYKPIPLSDDKYIELGFKPEFEYLELELPDNICLSYDIRLKEMLIGYENTWVSVKNPEYLHRLQNLVFALTNSELKL